MTPNELADRTIELRKEVEERAETASLDEYAQQSFATLIELLGAIERECRSGDMTPIGERYGIMARICVESDPTVLPPELGGQLIDVEEAYQSL